MNFFAADNIYLCDLEFLDADIKNIEEREHGQKVVRVSWPWRGPHDLLVAPCPQGYHVIKGIDVDLGDLADYLARQFEPRERITYFCFTKIREAKIRSIQLSRIIALCLMVVFAYRFYITGIITAAILCVLSLALALVTLFLPREALKTTYQDYLGDVETRDGDRPIDLFDRFHDRFHKEK